MHYCAYYDDKTKAIIDFFSEEEDFKLKSEFLKAWEQPIMQAILIAISEQQETTAPKIREKIGHSASTLHENIRKLEESGLITAEMIYKNNKQRVLKPKVLCVSRNPKGKASLKRFFQGMWVDSQKSKKVIEFLDRHPKKYFTPEEISVHAKIPVDDVELVLNNWESLSTRGLSSVFKRIPFEKKVLYRARK